MGLRQRLVKGLETARFIKELSLPPFVPLTVNAPHQALQALIVAAHPKVAAAFLPIQK